MVTASLMLQNLSIGRIENLPSKIIHKKALSILLLGQLLNGQLNYFEMLKTGVKTGMLLLIIQKRFD
jgi:hypothetical protein